MTEHLASTGAPVTAIEIDAPLVRRLQRLTQQFPNLHVVSSDVLKVDIAEIAAGRRVRIYGNLPYYITSPILHHLFAFTPIIDEIHIVIQLEVAERLAAEPGGRTYVFEGCSDGLLGGSAPSVPSGPASSLRDSNARTSGSMFSSSTVRTA